MQSPRDITLCSNLQKNKRSAFCLCLICCYQVGGPGADTTFVPLQLAARDGASLIAIIPSHWACTSDPNAFCGFLDICMDFIGYNHEQTAFGRPHEDNPRPSIRLPGMSPSSLRGRHLSPATGGESPSAGPGQLRRDRIWAVVNFGRRSHGHRVRFLRGFSECRSGASTRRTESGTVRVRPLWGYGHPSPGLAERFLQPEMSALHGIL